MITLAFAQMIYYVAIGLDRYGGDDGLTIYKRSQFGGLLDLAQQGACSTISASRCCSPASIWSARLVNSRFGLVIRGARSNERRMRAIGFPTFRYKLVCFVIAGALCGLAGALLANHTSFISPAMMHWTRSGDLIVMVVLGGMGSLFGPVIGAVAFLLLEEVLSRAHRISRPDPRAAAAAGRALCARRHRRPAGRAPPWLTPLLQIERLTQALRRRDRGRRHRARHCAAANCTPSSGPNGAGKTTLIGQTRRRARARKPGSIRFDGTDITGAAGLPPQPARARALVPDHLAVSRFHALDNVALAVQAHRGHSFRFWRDARREEELREPARAALARVGLARSRRHACRRAQSRRAPPARNRDGARHASRGSSCSTSRWPAWGRTKSARMVQMLRAAQGEHDDAADRARHGSGVRARRPHHRAGLRPRSSPAAIRRRSAPTPPCAKPISARRTAPAGGHHG